MSRQIASLHDTYDLMIMNPSRNDQAAASETYHPEDLPESRSRAKKDVQAR
jgi:hypothetical protein